VKRTHDRQEGVCPQKYQQVDGVTEIHNLVDISLILTDTSVNHFHTISAQYNIENKIYINMLFFNVFLNFEDGRLWVYGVIE
jgi:hypothetical protein